MYVCNGAVKWMEGVSVPGYTGFHSVLKISWSVRGRRTKCWGRGVLPDKTSSDKIFYLLTDPV